MTSDPPLDERSAEGAGGASDSEVIAPPMADHFPADAAPATDEASGAPATEQPETAENSETTGPSEDDLRLAEALVFANAAPVSARALGQILPDHTDSDAVLAALRDRYAGRGVELVQTAGGWQFRTAPDLAPRLRKVIEVPRRLPRVAMETLAIIAYHQPCTRAEIEEIRGTSLSQQTLDALLEEKLVESKGRRETPGRPTLWGTTPHFLAQFGLKDLRDLPPRRDLLLEVPQPAGVSSAPPIGPDGAPMAGDAAAAAPDGEAVPGESASGEGAAAGPEHATAGENASTEARTDATAEQSR